MNYTYIKEFALIKNLDHQYISLKETASILLQELRKAGEELKIFSLEENNTFVLWGLKFEVYPEIPFKQGITKFACAELTTYLVKDDKIKEQLYSCTFDSNGNINNDFFMRGEFGDFYIRGFIETLLKNAGKGEIRFLLG